MDTAFELEKQHSYRFWWDTCNSIWGFQCQRCERGASYGNYDLGVLIADVIITVEIRPTNPAHTFYECASDYAAHLLSYTDGAIAIVGKAVPRQGGKIIVHFCHIAPNLECINIVFALP